MKEWGGPLTMYVLVVIIASVGIGAGPDGDKWWVPLLAGFAIVPALGIAVIALIVGLDALWGRK